jgi:hypothetical protein
MILIINAFIRAKKFSSENSSQTAQIHAIKLDINHLKIQKCFENKMNLRLIFFQIKKISVLSPHIQEFE